MLPFSKGHDGYFPVTGKVLELQSGKVKRITISNSYPHPPGRQGSPAGMALKAHHRPATIPFHVNAGCLEIFDYDRGSGIFLKRYLGADVSLWNDDI